MKSLLFLLVCSYTLFGQPIIIPQPAVNQFQRGEFVVRDGLGLWSSVSCVKERALLQTYWQAAGLPVLTDVPKAKRADVVLLVDAGRQEALGSEGYELIVSPKRISITGATAAGVFYGLQTLRQVLRGSPIRSLRIRDKPRFGWRSFRLVESHRAVGMAVIRTMIDELALLKFNRFHWQLTESPGRFYTPEQIQEIVRYADRQHVAVIAQVEKPEPIVHVREDDPKQILHVANLGHKLVISTGLESTLNHPATERSLELLYRLEPIPDQMPEDLRPQILGLDFVYLHNQTTAPDSLPGQLHPRLAAAAEVAWTFAQHKDFGRFKVGLTGFYKGVSGR
ncbi:MAG: beta-N-acetylhexosaminidase [Rudanella sp.]|nr:beta-N-acetylhexosaminidase [Rudanella sp.]